MLKDYLALPLSHADHPVQLKTQKNSSIMLGSLASSRMNQAEFSSIDHDDSMLGQSNMGSPSRGQRFYLNSPSGLDNRPYIHSPTGGSAQDMNENNMGDYQSNTGQNFENNKKTAMTNQKPRRNARHFVSPSERSDEPPQTRPSHANSVMIGASSIADMQSGRMSPASGLNSYMGELAGMNVRSIALDSFAGDSVSSQLQSIQMEAFRNENHRAGKGGKGLKKMLNKCENLVKKTQKLSKFADESLAKVEKVCNAIKSKKLMDESKRRLLDVDDIKESDNEDATEVEKSENARKEAEIAADIAKKATAFDHKSSVGDSTQEALDEQHRLEVTQHIVYPIENQ